MISGVVITYNVENHLEKCLRSLGQVCDEIIVVDAQSTDSTRSIALRYGAKFFSRKWEGYGDSKNFGIAQSSNDWILSIDSDEYLSNELIESIKSLTPQSKIVYQFQRVNIYQGKSIHYGFFKPEWKKRLFFKDKSEWSPCEVHESLITNPPFTTQKCVGSLYHEPFETIEGLRENLNEYATLSAKKWKRLGYQPSQLKNVLGPAYHFIRSYFIQLGIIEGKLGLQLAREAALYNRMKLKAFKAL